MNGSIARSFQVAGESWRVLRTNPALAIFPILSAIASVIVSIPFLIPLWLAAAAEGATRHQVAFGVVHYALLAAMYFANYFVVIFFNAALVACAHEELNGRRTTVAYGVEMAMKRLPQILAWTAVASTVGLILKMISERVGIIGAIVIALVGVVWNVAVFFVVPIFVIERVGPIQALKDSTGMIKKTWGERIVLGFGLGTATGLLILLAMVPVGLSVAAFVGGIYALGAALICLTVACVAAVAIASASMNAIFQTALYIYCRTGAVPMGFQASSMQGAFREKPARKVFGRTF